MIFSELYSAYYNTVAAVLRAATRPPIEKGELRDIIEQNAFGESVLSIEPALCEERWQLIRRDGTTPLRHAPGMPLTTLEKRWLKAIFSDPRIRLFTDECPDFPDVEPLFSPDDITVFDRHCDGDPYEDESYIRNFRLILSAIKNRIPLVIKAKRSKGGVMRVVLMPEYLEYSEKDDKFRLIGTDIKGSATVNLSGIIGCRVYEKPSVDFVTAKLRRRTAKVEFELYDRRNALERVLMHFAHFEKQVERLEDDRYKVTITYDRDDETEIVIRILSFGPMVKVTSPERFVNLIKERLIKQQGCGH